MTMGEAVRSVLGQYATFSGRASRSEYWWWFLVVFLLNILLNIVDGSVVAPLLGLKSTDVYASHPTAMLAALVLFLPNLAVAVRRLHDRDRSGWWLLLGFIPVIGTLVLLIFFIQKGTLGDNRFGPPPL